MADGRFAFWSVWLFFGAELNRFEDFIVVFLYMDAGFFPVMKKAAPTKILGFGFKWLKLLKVKVVLDSAGLVLHAGAAALVDAGLSLCEFITSTQRKRNEYT